MQVAIYTRVSTKKQVEEGFSLEAQKDRLTKLCEINGDIVYKIYSDEGKSGKDTNRPELQKLLVDAKKRAFNKVLVMKLDRISRSISDLEKIVTILKENDIEFESASEKLDTSSSMGMMFIRLLGVFAQFERERIQERINDTFTDMIDKGRSITGSPPYGYLVGEDKKLIIDKEKQPIIEDFYNTFEINNSIRKTAIIMNKKYNISRYIKEWKKLLKNEWYYGKYRDNDNYFPSLIEKERWLKLNEILTTKNIKTTSTGITYLFSGLIKCPHCGNRFKAIKDSRCKTEIRASYYCGKGVDKLCYVHSKSIRQSIIENYLLNNLEKLLDNIEKEYITTYTEEVIKSNEKKINSIKEEISRLDYMFLKNRISQDDYDKEYTLLEKKLEKEKNKLPKKITPVKLETNWKEIYNKLTDENKRRFWRNIIDHIEIDLLESNEARIKTIFFK